MIGIFDSGLGGLTVLKELRSSLPGYPIVYLGDTARTPYGSKSRSTIERYAKEDAQFLQDRGVSIIVVACNTVSAVALHVVDDMSSHPVFDVVKPMVEAVVASPYRRIGVIGTRATIASGVYEAGIRRRSPDRIVLPLACPLFVPLVEEGFVGTPIADAVVAHYLSPLRDARIDAIILGCTHYPMLEQAVADYLGSSVAILNPARGVAEAVASYCTSHPDADAACRKGKASAYLTDITPHCADIAQTWLGEPLSFRLATLAEG